MGSINHNVFHALLHSDLLSHLRSLPKIRNIHICLVHLLLHIIQDIIKGQCTTTSANAIVALTIKSMIEFPPHLASNPLLKDFNP